MGLLGKVKDAWPGLFLGACDVHSNRPWITDDDASLLPRKLCSLENDEQPQENSD